MRSEHDEPNSLWCSELSERLDVQDEEQFPALPNQNAIQSRPEVHGKAAWSCVVRKGNTSTNFAEELVAAQLATSGFIFFMNFPLGIRQMVYEYAIPENLTGRTDNKIIVDDYSYKAKKFGGFLPRICFANKQVYDESMPLVIRRADFVIKRWANQRVRWLARLLETVPHDKAFHNVTNFTSCWYQWPARSEPVKNLEIELLRRCIALRYSQLKFASCNFYKSVEDQEGKWARVSRTAQETAQFHGIEGIFDCVSLRVVHLHCYTGYERASEALDVLKEFRDWMCNGFRAKGRKVEVGLSIRALSVFAYTRWAGKSK